MSSFVDRPVGIDLGTTNSEIALLDPSERELHVYADRFGRRTVPSAVAWDAASESFLVGRTARAKRGSASPPVESIKRRMGQDVRVPIGPHELDPAEVSAKILGELRDRMQEDLQAKAGETEVRVARAVITVPAYFDAPQVEATRRAGELAGLDVIGVLQEPTAAAIYHTWKSQLGDGNFLVYDLGGGTFDVSILRCMRGEYRVLAIDGDNYLGGDDLDRRFAERLRTTLAQRGWALDLRPSEDAEDARRFQRLVHLAQEIKEALSTNDVASITREDVLTDQAGERVSVELEVGRTEWEAAVSELVETTIAACERAIARSHEVAGVGLADIDHVLLVGGSTRAPLVVRRVTEALCSGKSKATAPRAEQVDTCVALGAAIHAAQIGGLRVGDERAQALFTTPLVTQRDVLALGLVLERAPAGVTSVTVVRGDERIDSDVGELPARVRVDVPLGDEAAESASLEMHDGLGAPLGALPFAVYRGEVRPRASSLSQPAVVAKDIALEVVRGGRRERKVLLPRGASLPSEAKHELATGDRSGAVVLRLLQNRLPIKTLVLEVPADLAVGTPVSLWLRCDEAMRLEARATVAGRELWSRVEPAPAPPATAAEVEALLAEAEDALRGLWGREAIAFRRELEPLTAGLREIAFGDPARVTALAAQLRQLLGELRGSDGSSLSPPLHRFEFVLDALRRVVYRAPAGLLGQDADQWSTRITSLDDRARTAWDAGDATTWRRTYDETQALLETAQTHEYANAPIDDPTHLARRTADLVFWAQDLERQLADFIPANDEEIRALQVAERDRALRAITDGIRPRLGREPTQAGADRRRELDALAAELERLEGAFERLPSLGLVSDRR